MNTTPRISKTEIDHAQFKTLSASILIIGFGFLMSSCTRKSSDSAPTTSTPASKSQVELVSDGRRAYLSNCIACHNSDPKADGPLGPSVALSSLELLETRVLRAEYPAGYQPKRPTKVMVALPHLKGEIAALHAYLNSL